MPRKKRAIAPIKTGRRKKSVAIYRREMRGLRDAVDDLSKENSALKERLEFLEVENKDTALLREMVVLQRQVLKQHGVSNG